MIWALVLAAGSSQRMGKSKLLLPFGTQTIIEEVLRAALSSKVDRVLVVIGPGRDELAARIKEYPVLVRVNPRPSRGMLSSVQTGLRALPKKTRAFVVLLGDQPSVSSAVIDRVIGAYRDTNKGIVVPVYRKRRGHPLLVDLKYRREIMGLDREVGLREILGSHPDDVCEARVTTAAVLRDIDSPEDYKRELRIRNKKALL